MNTQRLREWIQVSEEKLAGGVGWISQEGMHVGSHPVWRARPRGPLDRSWGGARPWALDRSLVGGPAAGPYAWGLR